ncbi:MAG: DUF1995 family protein [Cyanobacteria bacterium]|nr:DUF1995 family protein [Cyanobacteriota bacterium]MDW8202463.1 DUF1995 family protein [Cyanobacteriota bacterium SKYGB_h_bin112]
MTTLQLPQTLEDAITQAKVATKTALADGYTRLQVELVFAELKPMPVAEQFLDVFADYGANFKVYFPDAGAAALARRDWGPMAFEIRGIGELKGKLQPEDRACLVIAPSSVEVLEVEKLCAEAGDRPVVLLNPVLEDVATVGIGYAARQLRERFLSTIESCYYLRPLEKAAVWRCYPSLWQVWVETTDPNGSSYELLTELPHKPSGDELDRLLAASTLTEQAQESAQRGLFTGLQRFLRTLSQ